MKKAVLLILILLLLAGCSESADEMIKVTFDGNECTVSGITELTELTVGDHPFVVKNLTEDNISMQIGRLLDDHSFQDFVNNIDDQAPGRTFQPDWVSCCARFVATEKGESADEEIITLGIKDDGEHAIYLDLPGASILPCGPLKVVEAPSE
jgi:hypothetical protein